LLVCGMIEESGLLVGSYMHSAAKMMSRTWPKSKQFAIPSAKHRIMLIMPALYHACQSLFCKYAFKLQSHLANACVEALQHCR
jgi:hypothetical protein